MVVPVLMPRQGQSVESCIISKWHKRKGDAVEEGEILFTYETDKAAFEEEAKVKGTILDIFYEEGEDVPVLTNVCVISTEENYKISPRARNLAERTGVDANLVSGSGPLGRIIEKDIVMAKNEGVAILSRIDDKPSVKEEVKAKPVVSSTPVPDTDRVTAFPEEFTDIPLSNIRKVIAKAMHHSITSTAQLTLNASFDATDLLDYIKKIKRSKDLLNIESITLNDIILFTVSRTILNHKELNAHYFDDKLRLFNNVHIGIAVDTERGLMVPTIFNADKMTLNEISYRVKQIAQECRTGNINPDNLKGASFTVTNLGSLDIESFTPVLNPPQTAILGVGMIVQRVKEVDGQFTYYPAIGLSLTFDHRAVDGAPAARFLKNLKTSLENFSALLAK